MDEVEKIQRKRLAEINKEPKDRPALEAIHGQVWSTDELTREFEVQGFRAPFVVVKRTKDNQLGSLEFQHYPRFYFNFVPHENT